LQLEWQGDIEYWGYSRYSHQY